MGYKECTQSLGIFAVVAFASVALSVAVSTDERPFTVTFRRGVSSESINSYSVIIRSWLSVDPLDGGVPLSSTPELHLHWQVATSDSFDDRFVVADGRVATTSIGHGGRRASVEVIGLKPSQSYFYRFRASLPGGTVVHSQVGSFSTAPPTDGTTSNVDRSRVLHPFARRLATSNSGDDTVVGVLASALPAGAGLPMRREVPLGNLVCDSMLWLIRNQTRFAYSPTICLFNGGRLSPLGLPAGNVTIGAVKAALPFSDTIVLKEMTGLAILTALENSVRGNWTANEARSAFLQVAGLRYVFNGSWPVNQRVRNVIVRLQNGTQVPLNPCAKYLVATTYNLSEGGDGFSSIQAARRVEYGDVSDVTLAVAAFINISSPVVRYNTTNGRIGNCVPNPAPGSFVPALCLDAPMSFGSCPLNLTLLHYNDVHGRVEAAQSTGAACTETNEAAEICFGGFARMASYVKSIRASAARSNTPVLLLDAGDMSVGTEWDLVYANRTPSAVNQNALGVAAFTLGNHEFDYGVESLVSYISQLEMPILGCNVDAAATAPALAALVQRYTVVELGTTGVRAGIVGWVIPSTANTSLGGQNITFRDVVPAVQSCVAELKAAYGSRLDIIIGLSHGGFDTDVQVAAQVGDIDLIIGGHDHFFFYKDGVAPGPLLVANNPASGQTPDNKYPVLVDSVAVPGKVVPVTQAYYASRYMGNLQLAFDASGRLTSWAGQPVLLGGSASASPVPRDPATLDLIDAYGGALDELNRGVIGYNPVLLSSDRTLVRAQESALGNVVCDSMRWFLAQNPLLPPTDGCLVNGGSIRADLLAGNVTTGNVVNTLPYANAVALLNVTGAQLLAALENGVSQQLTNLSAPLDGRFAQVSGLVYSYSPSAPVGSRIQSVSIRKADGSVAPLEPCKSYILATTDYLAAGGDGYTPLKPAQRLLNFGSPMYMALRDYVTAFNPLPSGLEGRIFRCTATGQSGGCPAARNATDTCAPSPPPATARPPQRSPPAAKSPRPPPRSKPPSSPPKAKSPRPPPRSKPPSPPPRSKPPSPPPRTRPPSPPPKARSPPPQE